MKYEVWKIRPPTPWCRNYKAELPSPEQIAERLRQWGEMGGGDE